MRRQPQGAKAGRANAETEARKELLESDTPPSTLRQRRSDEQVAQNVTESLMELRQTMYSQVKRSEETVHTLATSSYKLGETKHEMDTIGSNVKVSHGLISKFERREITDKLLIFLGLVLFFGVVLYILKKRLLGWIW